MNEIRCSVEFEPDETRQSLGRITGVLMKYGTQARDRQETFAQGSLRWSEDGIVLNRQHSRQDPILRFVPVVDGDEVRINAAIPDSVAGRSIRNEIGTLFRGLSVEFRPIEERYENNIRNILAAELTGAGVVDSASYPTSVEIRNKKRIRIWL